MIRVEQQLPQQPRIYKPMNACSIGPSWQQLLTVGSLLIQILLHTFCILPQIIPWEWISLIFLYACLIVMIPLFVFLECFDPCDPNLIIRKQSTLQRGAPSAMKKCPRCECLVELASKHCSVCDRCCYQFDHHCVYLNNCIGSRNYKEFIAIVVLCLIYQTLHLYQSSFVFDKYLNNSFRPEQFYLWEREVSKWISLTLIILASILAVLLLTLLAFHIYIRCIISLSTYEWIKHTENQRVNTQTNRVVNRISPEPPISTDQLAFR